MSGRIIFEPRRPTACERGQCADKPKAEDYEDGTVWQCDECGSKWSVWSGAQYNEPFSVWRRTAEPVDGWVAPDRENGSTATPPRPPWIRPDACFGHCDPEGWHVPCTDRENGSAER